MDPNTGIQVGESNKYGNPVIRGIQVRESQQKGTNKYGNPNKNNFKINTGTPNSTGTQVMESTTSNGIPQVPGIPNKYGNPNKCWNPKYGILGQGRESQSVRESQNKYGNPNGTGIPTSNGIPNK
jgi:hypothetical protein